MATSKTTSAGRGRKPKAEVQQEFEKIEHQHNFETLNSDSKHEEVAKIRELEVR